MFTKFLRHYLRKHLKPEIYGPGLSGILRQGMSENPAVTLVFIGTPLVPLIFDPIIEYRRSVEGRNKSRYVLRYSIFRPDDPKLDMFDHPPKKAAEIRELRKKLIKERLTVAA